jgi:hypothetical protein
MVGNSEETICLLASEWWKASFRLLRLVRDAAPTRAQREAATAEYAYRRIEDALNGHGIQLVDHNGKMYGPSMAAEPVNPEDFAGEEDLIVLDTIEPTIMRNGTIIRRGKVVIGKLGAPSGEAA